MEVTMVLLSLAVVSSLAMIVSCYQRPLGTAFQLGYEAGRRDAIREATQRSGTVTPISRARRLNA